MRVLVGGVHLGGPGYPNAAGTLRLLRTLPGVQVLECGRWLPHGFQLWRLAQGSRLQAFATLSGIGMGNALSVLKVMVRRRRGDLVYVPYPGLFFLWLVSWLPRGLRPRCVADAYISIWDSLYRDRGAGDEHGLGSRILRWMEGRALRAAYRVIVDTEANRHYFQEVFGLPLERSLSFPLAIDEALFMQPENVTKEKESPLEVLFVGTFIPLHGIDVLVEGITPLIGDPRFHFCFLGDGQSAPLLDALQAKVPPHSFEWVKEWQTLCEVARRISSADICLGVFGGNEKAARVLPFKLYMYLAAGKPVVSQSLMSVPGDAPDPPVIGTQSSPESITHSLQHLAMDAPLRKYLGEQARSYYETWLGNAQLAQYWEKLLGARG